MESSEHLRLKALIREAEREWRDRIEVGPTRLRWRTLPVQVGDAAPDRTLRDRDGRQRLLSSFWEDGPALFIFWRHFGCGCGIERAARLRAEQPHYEDLEARVVVICQGEPERAAAYADEYDLDCTVLCAPHFEAYEDYGLLETSIVEDGSDVLDLHRLDDTALDELVIERREAGRPLVDNPWMLPGEFVVDRKGKLVHVHRYNSCGDYPDPRVLEVAIERAMESGAEAE
jgi:peroxiredoxin